ncbi:MAG: hypothetical protein AMJ79_08590 [Phycisphaerae bacterium SM23_30]|nr:MAG: hypothetical protein AMJ79_08590 [Phycisphaerae bacterium SM23_30]
MPGISVILAGAMRIRLLILLTDLEIGGVPLFVKDLAGGLAAVGSPSGAEQIQESSCPSGAIAEPIVTRKDTDTFQVRVACLAREGPVAQEIRRHGIVTHCLGARGPWDIRVFYRLAKVIGAFQPHILHCCLVHANVVGSIVGRFLDVPCVFASIHTAERGKLWHLTAENLTCRWSRTTVCVSKSVSRHVERLAHIPAARLRIIPYGINCRRFADARAVNLTDLGLKPARKTLVFVGRLDPVKAVDVLLNALSELVWEKKLNLQLLIVGDGPERQRLQQLTLKLKLSDRVCFCGARRDVERLLKSAEIFVMPSRWEGLPLAAVEAMAAGLPIVARRTEGLVDVVDHGSTGLLTPLEDVTELTQAIEKLIIDPNMAQRFGRAAQNRAFRKFSTSVMINNYVDLYKGLLRRSR